MSGPVDSSRSRRSWGKVISRQWGYHGVTLAAMSATGITAYWPVFEPRVPGFVHIPSPYPYRHAAPAGQSQGIAAADELEKAILAEGQDTVAMFIAEPVQGARLLQNLKQALADHPNVGEIRGLGLLCAVEMVNVILSQLLLLL